MATGLQGHFSSSPHAGPSRPSQLMSSPLVSSSSTGFNASCRGVSRLARTMPATQHHQRSSPRHMLKPGPLGLGKDPALDGTSSISGLRKQQFRQKCQDAMARDRKLDRGRKIAQSREHRSTTGTDSDDHEDERQSKMVTFSDDLSSSDVDEETREEREMEVSLRLDMK